MVCVLEMIVKGCKYNPDDLPGFVLLSGDLFDVNVGEM